MRSRRVKVLAVLVVLAAGAAGAAAGGYLDQRDQQKKRAMVLTRGDPDQALVAIVRFGCAACHSIPGARAPGGLAAQSLADVAKRVYLGGAVENTPDNLVRWIVNPKQFDPRTAMPITGISENEARNIAAYLYRLQG